MSGTPVLSRDLLRPRTVLAGFFAAVLFLAFVPQPRVSANEYVVTLSYPYGQGTLREAIAQANANPGPDTITFDMAQIGISWILFDGLCGDYLGDEGEMLITDDVTIVGPGSEFLSIEQRPGACDTADTRIFHIAGDATEVTISGLTFRYGEVAYAAAGEDSGHGGAIYNETATLTLSDCVFDSNRVNAGGDSVDSQGGDGGSGGAVYCATGDLTITDCTFEYNTAGNGGVSGTSDGSSPGTGGGNGGDGGAVYFAGETLLIEDSVFTTNGSGHGGNLLYCVDGAAGGRGGCGSAVYATGCTATITGCSFYGHETGSGGRQEDCSETAEPGIPAGLNGSGGRGGEGGALYVADTALTLDECSFVQDSAGLGGASLTQQAGSGGCGGALCAYGGSVEATDCVFQYNAAGEGAAGPSGYEGAAGNGGAIYAESADVTLTGCRFEGNRGGSGYGGSPYAPGALPDAGSGGSGGAVYVETATLNLAGTLFDSNMAGMGGYSEAESLWAAPGDGGAVWCRNTGSDALIASDCSFTYHSNALQGGAVYVSAGTAEMVNCTIAENWAHEGGGIWAADGVPVQLSFCTIAWNQAVDHGGGIYADSLALKGCIVANNTFYVSSETEPAQGTPDDGPDIYDEGGIVTSHGGNVLGISSGYTLQQVDPSPDDAVGVEAGLGVLTDAFDTLYVCTLLPDSPALDFVPAADGTAIDGTPVNADELGTSRPQDGDLDGTALWDAGAFESSVQTATVASATGSGDITVAFSDAGILDQVDARGVDEVCCEAPEGFEFPHGLLNIVITGLPSDQEPEPGEVTLTLIYPEDIPEEAMYWKCDPDGCEWVDVTDLLGDHDGDNVLTLTLTDGGDGDMDFSWNTEIHDPGGVVLAVEEEKKKPEERDRERPLKPASMNTCYLALGAYQALPGQTVQVSVNVCNGGEVKGNQSLVLAVNGVAEQSQSISVSGGSCKTVVFNVVKAVPGVYDIDINGQRAQLTVLAPRTVQATVPSTQDTGIGTAGIIAIGAVMAALIVALVVIFKR